ncbi:MAG: FAD-dependent oxidoreductase [Clostridia bacterium]|nr:FAD-dependent oxidoreductase [Clostridia bacterium]
MIKECIETKIVDSCDVLVAGGGFGGISAALAAARQGKKVILIEKEYILGGLGTAGIVTIYLPLCDGLGHQISFGIVEELFRLSISMGAEDRYPENWLDTDDTSDRNIKNKRFEVQYNPSLFAMMVEKLLIENGVEILYGTYAVATHKENDKITAVIVENKSGRQAIAVKSVVDATGDADIAKFAEAPTVNFKKGNVLAAWYYGYGKNGYKLHSLGFCDISDEEKKAGKSVPMLIDRRFSGLDGKEISEQTIMSHTSTLNDIKKRRADDPTLIPTMIATIPQLRMTRRIDGEYVLDESEVHTYFEDSIGMVSDWRKRGPAFEVPFRTLYSAKVKNLICAGRCTSVTDDMWDIMRVIPCCAVTGEAAGTAAALTDDFSALDVKVLQQKLVEKGVKLHLSDIGL